MNAIQMAIKSAIESAIGNLPPEVMQNIGQIGATVAGFKAHLDRIENQNRMIMDHLGISETTATKEIENHAGSRENGSL